MIKPTSSFLGKIPFIIIQKNCIPFHLKKVGVNFENDVEIYNSLFEWGFIEALPKELHFLINVTKKDYILKTIYGFNKKTQALYSVLKLRFIFYQKSLRFTVDKKTFIKRMRRKDRKRFKLFFKNQKPLRKKDKKLRRIFKRKKKLILWTKSKFIFFCFNLNLFLYLKPKVLNKLYQLQSKNLLVRSQRKIRVAIKNPSSQISQFKVIFLKPNAIVKRKPVVKSDFFFYTLLFKIKRRKKIKMDFNNKKLDLIKDVQEEAISYSLRTTNNFF